MHQASHRPRHCQLASGPVQNLTAETYDVSSYANTFWLLVSVEAFRDILSTISIVFAILLYQVKSLPLALGQPFLLE